MAHYTFDNVVLHVQPEEMAVRARLSRLWSNLSLLPTEEVPRDYLHQVSIHLHDQNGRIKATGRVLFKAGDFSVLQHDRGFYVTDDSSVFHLQAGHGDAYLETSFFSKPDLTQCNFWNFGLLKLLRPLNFYSLHAAGLVTPHGQGVLVVGPSGSGKSTLALGLIRHGWRYLTDDAVFLRPVPGRICALALRKHFYIDAAAARSHQDLPLGGEIPDKQGRPRRRVHLENTVLHLQRTHRCIPELLLFSTIVSSKRSVMTPVDPSSALKMLLEASGPQLFDDVTMGPHLDVLKKLLRQTRYFELQAGLDLYSDPTILVQLLSDVHDWSIQERA